MATQSVPQSRLGQETRGVGCIVDVLDRRHRITNTELDDSVNIDRHTVFSENLHAKEREKSKQSQRKILPVLALTAFLVIKC